MPDTDSRDIVERGYDQIAERNAAAEIQERSDEDGAPATFLWVVARKPLALEDAAR